MGMNETHVRRYFDAWNSGNEAALDELIAASYVHHDPANPDISNGPQGQKQLMRKYRTAFPDTHFRIDATVEQGDMVATRWTVTGTHKGELDGVAPTGKSVTVTGISLDRISGGKTVEGWSNWDALGLLQQLGVVRRPAAAGARA
jgi:steroid delta-isomerase-like uncharacterized protein